jgi:hypothetical protein
MKILEAMLCVIFVLLVVADYQMNGITHLFIAGWELRYTNTWSLVVVHFFALMPVFILSGIWIEHRANQKYRR